MPYKGWPNKKVTEQVTLGYRLPKPASCMDAIYEIMIKCWNKNVKVSPHRAPHPAAAHNFSEDQSSSGRRLARGDPRGLKWASLF
jgi:hypothetical protein